MRMLVRRDPIYREMAAWRNAMDRFFGDLPEAFWPESASAWSLPLDVTENVENYTIKASVPGVKPEDMDITVTDNVLTIKGEIKDMQDVEEGRYHLRERRFGAFQRSITLPTLVQADAIEATYVDGVLTLNVPKVEEVKPKRIAVKIN